MNENEVKYFRKKELKLYDATSFPLGYLLKALFIKIRRRIYGKFRDRKARIVWTASSASNATGPEANVRNYTEMQTIHSILRSVHDKYPISTACEVGCGYGRLTMVLGEFSRKIVGFEREEHLLNIAKELSPTVDFYQVESLDNLSGFIKDPFDFAMTCTVLQHLTDDFCRKVLDEIKRLSPKGHILLIEKTEKVGDTANIKDGNSFISCARPIDTYAKWMSPYKLISTKKRRVEPTYFNQNAGTCMLFRSPLLLDKEAES